MTTDAEYFRDELNRQRKLAVAALEAAHKALRDATPKCYVIGTIDFGPLHTAHDRAWNEFVKADTNLSALFFPDNYPEICAGSWTKAHQYARQVIGLGGAQAKLWADQNHYNWWPQRKNPYA